MIELGKILIKDESSIVEARNRIRLLAEDLKFNSFAATRLATITSELSRVIYKRDAAPSIAVAFDKRKGTFGLVLTFQIRKEDLDAAQVEVFFDEVRVFHRKDGFQRIEAFKYIPYPEFQPTKPFIEKERERLIRFSREELLREVKSKNEELLRLLGDLKREVTERQKSEQAQRKLAYNFRRLKERRSLYGISRLVQKPSISLQEIFEGALEFIPPAWQYPEITCARIIMEGREFKTKNFRETTWKQISYIILDGNRIGTIEVCYLEERPESDEGPFMKEERDLIKAIGEQLARIVERKKTEQEIESLSRFPSENPNPVLRIASDGKVLYANAAGEKIFKVQLGRKVPEQYLAIINRAVSSEECVSLEEKVGERYFSSVIRAIPKTGYLNMYSRDITDRKEAEVKLKEYSENLEETVKERTSKLQSANKELEAFSYSVSHDLRAPLRAIDGFSRALFEDYSDKLDAEGKRFLNIIQTNTANMGQLISDLLAFAGLGRRKMRFSIINMENLVKTVFQELKTSGPGKQPQLNLKKLPPATGDPTMIHQVLTNLLSNAIKFSRPKRNAVIEVGSTVKGKENIYYVKDNGVGFEMRYQDKLFVIFQRLHTADEFEGTGVGLAIVQRIIHRHGGRMWAEGAISKGATFYFTIPGKG